MSTATVTAADPVLVALAEAHPDLDDIRWLVRLPDGTFEYIRGERIETDDPRALRFLLTDLTLREFAAGEWTSTTGMPGKPGPDLDAITFRLWRFGRISRAEYLNRGAWLQAQPEWIAAERAHLADDPAGLAEAERIHLLRTRGL